MVEPDLRGPDRLRLRRDHPLQFLRIQGRRFFKIAGYAALHAGTVVVGMKPDWAYDIHPIQRLPVRMHHGSKIRIQRNPAPAEVMPRTGGLAPSTSFTTPASRSVTSPTIRVPSPDIGA